MGKRVFLYVILVVALLVPSGAVWAETPEPETESAPEGVLAYPVFDADATKMRYIIWTVDLATGKKAMMLENASQPAFSHDGKSIAYKDWTEDQARYGVHAASLADMKGTGWRFGDSLADQRPGWALDDAFFYYHSRKESDRENRVMVTESVWTNGHTILRPDVNNRAILGKSPAVVLVEADTYDILYQGCEFADCGVMRRSINGTNRVQLSDDTSAQALSVSPDSQWIAYMTYNKDDDWEIYLMGADGSQVKRLTENPGVDALPTWSPDGEWIAFVREMKPNSNEWSIMAIKPDGTGEQKLADLGMLHGMVKGTTADQCSGWWEEQITWRNATP